MPIADDQIAELKHSYQVLGAPFSASASSIKQTYRKLVKRWHPDLYPNGTPEYAEATHMTKLINGAYAQIEDAPLRYHIDAFPAAYVAGRQFTHPSPNQPSATRRESLPQTDWLEFWIRFVCGAFLGALLGVRELLMHYYELDIWIPVCIGFILVFAFAAAQSGDNFWHSVLRRWWLWW